MCGPSSSRFHVNTSAPSKRILPLAVGQIPSNARANVDLPAPPPMPTLQAPP